MKRRQFISYACVGGLAFKTFGLSLLERKVFTVSDEELLGIKSLSFLNPEIKLRDDAYRSFVAMQKAAYKDGIHITAASAFRSYEDQKRIWNKKYKSFIGSGLSHEEACYKITEYSTIPGTSRHHWGTDVDIIDTAVNTPKNVLSTQHFIGEGVYRNLKDWMDKHSTDFDFHLVYTDTEGRKGFKFEPWHYSYASLSKPYLKEYRERRLIDSISKEQFEGSKKLSKKFIEQYYTENILDINTDLL